MQTGPDVSDDHVDVIGEWQDAAVRSAVDPYSPIDSTR
jgi:hypothetical protein